MNSMQVYMTVPDIQSKVQHSLMTTCVISLLPNNMQTLYILEGNIVIYTCVNDETKSIKNLFR